MKRQSRFLIVIMMNKIITENIIKKSNCDYVIMRLPSVISKNSQKD